VKSSRHIGIDGWFAYRLGQFEATARHHATWAEAFYEAWEESTMDFENAQYLLRHEDSWDKRAHFWDARQEITIRVRH